RFAARLSYLGGDFQSADTYAHLAGALGEARGPVFYLEVPPSLFATVVKGLAQAKLLGDGARVVVEKPFGHDLQSARALAAGLHHALSGAQLYGTDHSLAN